MKLTKEDRARLQSVKDKLDKHFKTDFTILELSTSFRMNDHKLRYGFEFLYGKSIHEYQVEKRLECFRELLGDDDVSIGQAAYEAGFNNISTLNRAFKRLFSITPTEWRKRQLMVTFF
jgi:AraC-like DNA-binding protein